MAIKFLRTELLRMGVPATVSGHSVVLVGTRPPVLGRPAQATILVKGAGEGVAEPRPRVVASGASVHLGSAEWTVAAIWDTTAPSPQPSAWPVGAGRLLLSQPEEVGAAAEA